MQQRTDPLTRHGQAITTDFLAGVSQKRFSVNTDLLVIKSPYFAALARPKTPCLGVPNARCLLGSFNYPDLDEFAFALFVRWLSSGDLQPPHDFHSMNHHLCLYVLAHRFEIEELKNLVIDRVRGYYHAEEMPVWVIVSKVCYAPEVISRQTSPELCSLLKKTAEKMSGRVILVSGGTNTALRPSANHFLDSSPTKTHEATETHARNLSILCISMTELGFSGFMTGLPMYTLRDLK